MTRRRMWILALISFGAGAIVIGWGIRSRRTTPASPLVVQFAYPVTSIDPTLYDDWESVFIGNHIYRRLLPEEDKPWIPHLTRDIQVDCETPANTANNCESVKITFKPMLFADCMGRQYSIDDVRNEFHRILKGKAWIIPHWKPCDGNSEEICVRAKNIPNLERRLKNVYLRFGWLKNAPSDKAFGAGSYCLEAKTNGDRKIISGTLIPQTEETRFPKINFHVSQDAKEHFHLALYGSKSLLKDERRNVHAHTPLAYYVVTNPRLVDFTLPWNSAATRDLINQHLVKYEVFFAEMPQYMRLAPEGSAIGTKRKHASAPSEQLELMMPDFLPHCPELAAALNKLWGAKSNAQARCGDVITYVVERVMARKGPWAAFLVGASPSDPGRESIKNQYFSPDSSESWTYDHARPDELFYLVGMGQSLVTVDSKVVCDIRPNPLGLGDVYVTDILGCR